jgi:hypothetical protein
VDSEIGAEIGRVMRGATPIHFHLRRRLILVFGATGAVALAGALAIYFFERHAPGTKIHTYGDSLFWTSAQLLTVSSQLPNPISTGGRVLDIFLEAWAITVVATLAGSFGSFFTHKGLQAMRAKGGSAGDLIN